MKKSTLLNDQEILNKFNSTWPLDRVRKMKLNDYVNINNPDTFCQYIESQTRQLGSNKGITSLKFGIYKRKPNKKKPQNAKSDETYTWQSSLKSNTCDDAFKELKKRLIEVITAAQKNDLESIDNINLYKLFKWKVAFLYSDEAFIPIFKKDALHTIGRKLGMEITNKTSYSSIHRFILSTKPFGISVFDYMRHLYNEYQTPNNKKVSKIKKRRKSSGIKNTEPHERKGYNSLIVNQFHNEIQNKLAEHLKSKYGEEKVSMEENYVDIKVELINEIQYYEVKTNAIAERCIREGLGQLLSYIHYEKSKKNKRMIIFGPNQPTIEDRKFIQFLSETIQTIPFEYISLNDL